MPEFVGQGSAPPPPPELLELAVSEVLLEEEETVDPPCPLVVGESLPPLPTKIEMEDLLDWLEAGRRQAERAARGGDSDQVSL